MSLFSEVTVSPLKYYEKNPKIHSQLLCRALDFMSRGREERKDFRYLVLLVEATCAQDELQNLNGTDKSLTLLFSYKFLIIHAPFFHILEKL